MLVLTGIAATAGFAILTQLPAGGGYHPLFAAVMLVGFGTAGMAFGSMVTASAGVADSDQGLVGGVINTSRQLGAAMGAALLPAVADAVDRTGHSSLAVGDRAAMLAGAVAAGLATLVALGARRKPPRTPAPVWRPEASRPARGLLPVAAAGLGNLHDHQHGGCAQPRPAAPGESPRRLAPVPVLPSASSSITTRTVPCIVELPVLGHLSRTGLTAGSGRPSHPAPAPAHREQRRS